MVVNMNKGQKEAIGLRKFILDTCQQV